MLNALVRISFTYTRLALELDQSSEPGGAQMLDPALTSHLESQHLLTQCRLGSFLIQILTFCGCGQRSQAEGRVSGRIESQCVSDRYRAREFSLDPSYTSQTVESLLDIIITVPTLNLTRASLP